MLCKKLSESLYLESSGSCWSQGTVTQPCCDMVQAKDEAQISIEGHGQTSELTHWPQVQHGGWGGELQIDAQQNEIHSLLFFTHFLPVLIPHILSVLSWESQKWQGFFRITALSYEVAKLEINAGSLYVILPFFILCLSVLLTLYHLRELLSTHKIQNFLSCWFSNWEAGTFPSKKVNWGMCLAYR